MINLSYRDVQARRNRRLIGRQVVGYGGDQVFGGTRATAEFAQEPDTTNDTPHASPEITTTLPTTVRRLTIPPPARGIRRHSANTAELFLVSLGSLCLFLFALAPHTEIIVIAGTSWLAFAILALARET